MEVQRNTSTYGRYVTLSIMPEEIAEELIREYKRSGAASGSVDRLARQAAAHRYPSLDKLNPGDFIINIRPPQGKSGWGWENKWSIMQNWVGLYPRPTIRGYYFSFSPPYADYPGTLGIHKVESEQPIRIEHIVESPKKARHSIKHRVNRVIGSSEVARSR